MIKKALIITSIAGVSVLNQWAKSQIYKTKAFKQTIQQVKTQLQQINVKINIESIKSNTEQNTQQDFQKIFESISELQTQKLLSKKSHNRIQLIKTLKQNNNNQIKTNCYITLIHTVGALVYTPYFYFSALGYCFLSQISLVNDLYTVKTGNRLVNWPFKTIGELYLKISAVSLLFFSLKVGVKKLADMAETKQIVKKQP